MFVVYDAEDRLNPANSAGRSTLSRWPPNLAAVQASLSIADAADSWLTRKFTVEYAPCSIGSARTRRVVLPIPLGGTSNHFRTAALTRPTAGIHSMSPRTPISASGWRRSGYRCADVWGRPLTKRRPPWFMSWLRQRTRWLKGYMQTWLVHMRDPAALWPSLARAASSPSRSWSRAPCCRRWRIPGSTRSPASILPRCGLLGLPESPLGWPFWLIACFNLSMGYLASMALGALALRRRGYRRATGREFPLMPVYWLLISAAAYRALWQFAFARFEWEKTEHGPGRAAIRDWG